MAAGAGGAPHPQQPGPHGKLRQDLARTVSNTAESRKNSVTPINSALIAAGSSAGRAWRSCRASSGEETFNVRRQAGTRRNKGSRR